MKINNLLSFFSISLLFIILTGCSEKDAIEIVKSEQVITESAEKIQLEFSYQIVNNTNEDHYFTFIFPPYIQSALSTQMGPIIIPVANNTGIIIVTINKSGPDLTEEIIESILNGELPFVNEVVSLN